MNHLPEKLILIAFVVVLATIQTFSQLKYEKENRLKLSEIPVAAQQLVDSFGIHEKIRWYSEQGLTGKTIEAKFRLNKRNYSIEFDTYGQLQDIEIEIKFQDLPEKVKENIIRNLEAQFTKFVIKKIQIQYSGDYPEIRHVIKYPVETYSDFTKYELVVNGKTGNTTKQYEINFDNDGMFSGKREIIQKNADNLEF